jgi:hypothetical protein
MTDRDRIADIMADAAERQCAAWDRQGVPPWQGLCDFGFIADRLIAAGVTLPEPTCGATAVVDGNEYVCDQPPHHAARFAPVRFTWPHSCTDSVGTVRWWDGWDELLIVDAPRHPRPAPPWRERCPKSDRVGLRCTLTAGHDGECP